MILLIKIFFGMLSSGIVINVPERMSVWKKELHLVSMCPHVLVCLTKGHRNSPSLVQAPTEKVLYPVLLPGQFVTGETKGRDYAYM